MRQLYLAFPSLPSLAVYHILILFEYINVTSHILFSFFFFGSNSRGKNEFSLGGPD